MYVVFGDVAKVCAQKLSAQVGRRVAGSIRDAEGAELGEIAVVKRMNYSGQRAWSPALPTCSIAVTNSGDAGCADGLRRAQL